MNTYKCFIYTGVQEHGLGQESWTDKQKVGPIYVDAVTAGEARRYVWLREVPSVSAGLKGRYKVWKVTASTISQREKMEILAKEGTTRRLL